MNVENHSTSSIGWRLRCNRRRKDTKGPPCGDTLSPTRNTIFEGKNASFYNILFLSFCYSSGMTLTDITRNSSISSATVAEWYKFFREICALKISDDLRKTKIGAPSLVVQIDETFLRKRKYNAGKKTKDEKESRTIIGGVCIETGEAFSFVVNGGKRETILPVMQKHVHQNSIIHSDGATIYKDLVEIGKQYGWEIAHHDTVIHSKRQWRKFDTEYNKVTTNGVENLWRWLKSKCSGRGTKMDLQIQIHSYLYERKYLSKKEKNGEKFFLFINLMKEFFPGPFSEQKKERKILYYFNNEETEDDEEYDWVDKGDSIEEMPLENSPTSSKSKNPKI